MNQDQIMQQLQDAVSLHNSGDLESAEAIYRDVLSVDPNNFYASRFYGCLLSAKGDYDKAIAFLEQAAQVSPSDSEVRYNLGNAFRSSGDLESAILQYERAVELGSSNPQVFNNLGRSLQDVGKSQEAIPILEVSISLNAACYGAWFALGNSWRDMGDENKSIFCYQKSISVSPEFVDAHLNLAALLYDQGRGQEAIVSYRKAIDIKPDFADAYLNLGITLKEEGEVEEAIVSYCKAIDIKPDLAMAVEALCSTLIGKGQIQDAKQVLCSFLDSKDVPIYLEWLSHCLSGVEVSFLDSLDLSDPETALKLKYELLRRLRSWICVADCLEGEYDRLYQELYARFGIQGLDTTNEIGCFKPLAGWSFFGSMNSTLRPYSSRFLKSGHSLALSAPFSSDINHLSGAGHFYLLLSSRLDSSVDLLGKRFELSLDYKVESLPIENLCLGFSAKVCDDWGPSDRSHAYVPLVQRDPGLFVAEIDAPNLLELGVNSEHFTASRYKLWDPVETARNVLGIFLFIRSPDYPVNPKGSVTIHSFNVI